MESLIAIAQGQEPPVEVGTLSLGDYAPYMSAPHRMDLMVSAMTQDGAWHCNQKCLHCYAAGQPMGESRELTTAQWKEALERLRHANIPQVTFTGGEPTLQGRSGGIGGGCPVVCDPPQHQRPPADAGAVPPAV